MTSVKNTINFLDQQQGKQRSIQVWILLSLLIAVYGGLGITWLSLVVYRHSMPVANQPTQTSDNLVLIRQKRQLLKSLLKWDQNYQSQLQLIQLWRWLLAQPYIERIDYQSGHLTIKGRSDSQSQASKLKKHLQHFQTIQSVSLKRIHQNNQGQWLFTLRGIDHD